MTPTTHPVPPRQGEQGGALLLVLVLLLVLTPVVLALGFIAMNESRVSTFDRDYKGARYVAERGLKDAEAALLLSYSENEWDDDLGLAGQNRPTHEYDKAPQSLTDRSLDRNGLMVYRWKMPPTPGDEIERALYRVPVSLQGGNNNARYTVWVRNNADDYGGTVTDDNDDRIEVIALGELLDVAGRVKARSYLSEIVQINRNEDANYQQKGLGAGGANTIEE